MRRWRGWPPPPAAGGTGYALAPPPGPCLPLLRRPRRRGGRRAGGHLRGRHGRGGRDELRAAGRGREALEDALAASRAARSADGAVAASLREEVARLGEEAARRDGEGAERVALEAQLDAQVREHARVEGRLRDELGDAGRALEEGARLREEESGRRDAKAVRTGETIAALEAHQLSLKELLSEQRCVLDASKEEEIGRLRGEIANLESRLRSEFERMESAGAASEARVRELEEVIHKGRAGRKR